MFIYFQMYKLGVYNYWKLLVIIWVGMCSVVFPPPQAAMYIEIALLHF